MNHQVFSGNEMGREFLRILSAAERTVVCELKSTWLKLRVLLDISAAAEQGLGEDVTGRLRNDLKMVEQELVGRGSSLPPYPTEHGLTPEGLRHETLAGFPESNVYYHIFNPFVYLPTSTPYLSGILMGGGDDPGSLHAVFADLPSNDQRTHWRFDNKGNNLYAVVNRYWESAYSGTYGGYMSGGPGESFLMCGAKNGDQNTIWFLDPTSLHISPPSRQDLTLITHDGIIFSYGCHWNYALIYVSNVFGNNDLHHDTV